MASFQCPNCRNNIEIASEMVNQIVVCPFCMSSVTVDSSMFQMAGAPNFVQTPAPPEITPAPPYEPASGVPAGNMVLQQQGDGVFVSDRDYQALFDFVMRILQSAGVSVTESNPAAGMIRGKASYGINLFGMIVRCNFSNYNNMVLFKITAMLVDSFDAFGATRKKVQDISWLILSSKNELERMPASFSPQLLPAYNSSNSGNYLALANTGRVLAIVGIFVPFLSLIALVISIVVLCISAGDDDSETRQVALTGLLIAIGSIVLTWLIWDLFWAGVWLSL